MSVSRAWIGSSGEVMQNTDGNDQSDQP